MRIQSETPNKSTPSQGTPANRLSRYIGSVYAGNDLARSAMGAAFPVFAGAMFRNLGLDWGCSLLGFLSIAFIPIPVALYVYGRKIRMSFRFFCNAF
jgi:DHA1 family multidrug resistance protein-like MFS transporter